MNNGKYHNLNIVRKLKKRTKKTALFTYILHATMILINIELKISVIQ